MARFENEYGYCELNDFPGCKRIVVSNNAYIFPEHRGKGHGYTNHLKRLVRAKRMGYDIALATIRDDNAPEVAIVTKAGWMKLIEFGSRAGGTVSLWCKYLSEVTE